MAPQASTAPLSTLADVEAYLEGFFNVERTRDFDYERLGLTRIRRLLETQGHPERELACVHIAGSKGKGSVALATERLLLAAGRRVGTYTSPHLESWRERFRVDAEPVPADLLARTLERMRPAIERQRADPELCPSFFDVTTALALVLFRDQDVDAAVVEVGLGGRLDSTNVVEPRVCVVTSIELEHTDKLGDTFEAIATEKAGILKSRVPCLHGELPTEALSAVVARAIAEDCPLEAVRPASVRLAPAGLEVVLEDGRLLAAPVLGVHQGQNLALAVRASECFLGRPLEAGELESLSELELPARSERIGQTILDVAHTPESARALRGTLETLWPERPWLLVVALSKDKDAASVLQVLAPRARHALLTEAEPLRSRDSGELEALAWASGLENVESVPDPHAALTRARELEQPGDLLVVAGSIYLAGVLRGRLVEECVDSPA